MGSLRWIVAGCVLASGVAHAGGKGEGACVIRDTSNKNYAPVYRSEDGTKTEAQAERGDCFGGITTMGLYHEYNFERKNGRVHITYLSKKTETGLDRTAWMDENDLEFFTYECGCGAKHKEGEDCSPFRQAGFVDMAWNPCFKEARDKKLGELKARWAGGAAPAAAPQGGGGAKNTERALTNDDVVSLFKAGLGDDLVVAKIQQSPNESLDVSTDALIKLKKEGVSKPVLDAMVRRAGLRK